MVIVGLQAVHLLLELGSQQVLDHRNSSSSLHYAGALVAKKCCFIANTTATEYTLKGAHALLDSSQVFLHCHSVYLSAEAYVLQAVFPLS